MVPIAEQVSTDSDGRCRIIPFARPDYTTAIKVVSKDALSPTLAVSHFEKFLNVAEELRRGIVIATQPALHISGRISVEGEPLDNIWINVGQLKSHAIHVVESNGRRSPSHLTSYPSGQPMHVRTNAEGLYEAWVDAKQTHWDVSLNAGFPNDCRNFPAHEVEYSDPFHARIDIDLKRGSRTLTGKVVDQSGNPVPMARVRLVATAGLDPATMYEATEVSAGYNGVFRLSGLPAANSYSLYAEVHHQGQGPRSAKSEIVTTSSAENITITVKISP